MTYIYRNALKMIIAAAIYGSSGCTPVLGTLDMKGIFIVTNVHLGEGATHRNFPPQMMGLNFREDGSITPFIEAEDAPPIKMEALPISEWKNTFYATDGGDILAKTARLKGNLPEAFGLAGADVYLTSFSQTDFYLSNGKVDVHKCANDEAKCLLVTAFSYIEPVSNLAPAEYQRKDGTKLVFTVEQTLQINGKTSALDRRPLHLWRNPHVYKDANGVPTELFLAETVQVRDPSIFGLTGDVFATSLAHDRIVISTENIVAADCMARDDACDAFFRVDSAQ